MVRQKANVPQRNNTVQSKTEPFSFESIVAKNAGNVNGQYCRKNGQNSLNIKKIKYFALKFKIKFT